MYDVIIAGAGPAGSTAAKHLAEQGRRVLLVEKCRLPRYKSCSGILIEKSMALVQQYYGETVPASVLCTPADNRGMIFTDDRGREYRFEQKGLNVWRSSFDHWLASRAADCGAEVREHTMVTECIQREESVTVTLQGDMAGQETARYFLDCEGAAGTLRKRLTGIDPGYITTFQTFLRGRIRLDPHYFYAYLQPELSEYDAWFNVKDGMLVLGVAVRDPAKIQGFYRSFLSWMENRYGLRIEEERKSEKWLMPRILPGCPVTLGENRILFAGETAGFLNPMGEGVSAGMESGFFAADAVLRHADSPERVLPAYLQSVRPLKHYMERQWSFVAGMADTFREMLLPDSPYGTKVP